ncbi:MAG: hypothetical protein AAGF77_13050, partial [Bacteroidota bacterium]
MKFRWLLLLLLTVGCQTKERTTETVLEYFPPNYSAILKINDLDRFRSELKNNTVLQTLQKNGVFGDFEETVTFLELVRPTSPFTLAF